MQERGASSEAGRQKIVTLVRLRPMLQHEEEKEAITLKSQKSLLIEAAGGRRVERVDLAMGDQSTQRQLFQEVQPLLEKTMEGFNVSLLTYGQTGSGKTHTMFGSDWSNIIRRNSGQKQEQTTFLRSIEQDENYAGIIPRTIHLLFNELIAKRRKFIKVYCSFLQIYNEHMADLLHDDPKQPQKLVIHQNKQDGIYVEGLNQVAVQDPDQCLELMRRGERNRVVRQTHMNVKSSRSHTIFTLLIEEIFPSKKSYRRMKINLCDLAGSQKIHKKETMNTQHFEELRNINLSLTTLGKVISSLGSQQAVPPYRQSRLTRLLQDSLGGNTNTAIIATVTPKISCVEESLNTLRFLERAKQVKSEVVAKVYSDNPEMRNLEREISYLRDMLKMRGGHVPTDIEMREKFKFLQQENSKLKEMVDQNKIELLMKENNHLKQQLVTQKNDALSESFIKMTPPKPHYKTIDPTQTSPPEDGMYSVSSQGNTRKFGVKRGARTDEASSYQGSTQHRGTGFSLFPNLSKPPASRSSSKILDRIMEIERTKQINRLKLERELQLLDKQPGRQGKKGVHLGRK